MRLCPPFYKLIAQPLHPSPPPCAQVLARTSADLMNIELVEKIYLNARNVALWLMECFGVPSPTHVQRAPCALKTCHTRCIKVSNHSLTCFELTYVPTIGFRDALQVISCLPTALNMVSSSSPCHPPPRCCVCFIYLRGRAAGRMGHVGGAYEG